MSFVTREMRAAYSIVYDRFSKLNEKQDFRADPSKLGAQGL